VRLLLVTVQESSSLSCLPKKFSEDQRLVGHPDTAPDSGNWPPRIQKRGQIQSSRISQSDGDDVAVCFQVKSYFIASWCHETHSAFHSDPTPIIHPVEALSRQVTGFCDGWCVVAKTCDLHVRISV
jgi:hypothetical protein